MRVFKYYMSNDRNGFTNKVFLWLLLKKKNSDSIKAFEIALFSLEIGLSNRFKRRKTLIILITKRGIASFEKSFNLMENRKILELMEEFVYG